MVRGKTFRTKKEGRPVPSHEVLEAGEFVLLFVLLYVQTGVTLFFDYCYVYDILLLLLCIVIVGCCVVV